MTEEKSRNRRRISIDGAGIERRRTAIQAIVDLAPPAADQIPMPRPIANNVNTVNGVNGGPHDRETPRSPLQGG